MRVIIHPLDDPDHELDVTHRLVAAIAEELWRRRGGNETVNWLEAEAHLECIVGQARGQRTTRRRRPLRSPTSVPAPQGDRS